MKTQTFNFQDSIEQGILSLCLLNPDFLVESIGLISAEHFDLESRSAIFKIVKAYFETHGCIPHREIILEECRELIDEDEGETLGIYEEELDEASSIEHSLVQAPEYYLGKLEEFAQMHAALDALGDCLTMVEGGDRAGILDRMREALQISRNIDLGVVYGQAVANRWLEDDQGEFRTPFAAINNNRNGGMDRGEFACVVAPPGVGKSWFLVNQGVESMMQGKKVLYVTLELNEKKVGRRFDQIISDMGKKAVMAPGGREKLSRDLGIFQKQFPKSGLRIKQLPSGSCNTNTIRTLLVNLKTHQDFVPDLLIVDYMELLRANTTVDAEYIEQKKIVEELCGLAVETNCLIWSATQPNREGETATVITRKHLGDSHAKSRPMDLLISINQNPEEASKNIARVYVAKDRDGEKSGYTVNITFDPLTMKMRQAVASQDDDTAEPRSKAALAGQADALRDAVERTMMKSCGGTNGN